MIPANSNQPVMIIAENRRRVGRDRMRSEADQRCRNHTQVIERRDTRVNQRAVLRLTPNEL